MQNRVLNHQFEELANMKKHDQAEVIRKLLHNQRKILTDGEHYYDEKEDSKWIDEYYQYIKAESGRQLYQQLNQLVVETHTYKPPYYISKDQFLYTWVDLQPDGYFKSIYSGERKHPTSIIEKDFFMILKRFEQYEQLHHLIDEKETENRMIHISREHRFNTEHVVPQSWFKAKEPMKGDLHHLFVCEPECNILRSNFPYYEFEKSYDYTKHYCGLYNQDKFEPENGKGEVARATLYFLLRYPKTITKRYRKEININLFKRWNNQYPVTAYEKHRNKAIYEIQGNRNPFIDFPNWANIVEFNF